MLIFNVVIRKPAETLARVVSDLQTVIYRKMAINLAAASSFYYIDNQDSTMDTYYTDRYYHSRPLGQSNNFSSN